MGSVPGRNDSLAVIVDAALNPAEIALLPQRDLSATVCVVFDVLRATSSMTTALAHGTREIYPVATIEEALALKQRIPDAVLGGERHGDSIQGFDVGNNPLDYTVFSGRSIITTTTNGTVALKACNHAAAVLVGSLLNLEALRAALSRHQPEQVLLVCAGTFETFALEDAYAAGELVNLLDQALPTDAALALTTIARHFASPLEALLASRNGRALVARGWMEQVEFCGNVSRFHTVGAMTNGVVQALQL